MWKVSLIAGLAGILYGYDMGIIAAALVYVRGSFSLSTQMEEVGVSVVLVGAMLGAVLGGTMPDSTGRKARPRRRRNRLVVWAILRLALAELTVLDRCPPT